MIKATFFSYKGGSGRTTTLFNTLPFLAKKLNASAQHPIVIFDMDFRSAGITVLLSNGKAFDIEDEDKAELGPGQRHSLQYIIKQSRLMCGDIAGFRSTLAESVGRSVGLEDNDAVLLVGANLHYSAEAKSEADVIKALQPYLQRPLAAASMIIFDSPSGTQVTANVSISRSNVVVCCMRPSYQFRQTTLGYLTDMVNAEAATDAKKSYILLLTAVPVKDMEIEGRYQISASYQDVLNKVSILNKKASHDNRERRADNPIIDTSMIEDRNNLGIREVERFKWSEKKNLYTVKKEGKETLTNDEQRAIENYEKLANLIIAKGN